MSIRSQRTNSVSRQPSPEHHLWTAARETVRRNSLCILNIHKSDDAVSIISLFFLFSSLIPSRQRGQSSRAQDSVDGILTSGFTCGHSILIVGRRTHPHVPTVRLPPLAPSSLHAQASGTEPRKDCSCFFVVVVVSCWKLAESRLEAGWKLAESWLEAGWRLAESWLEAD